jgi:sec-independent protein translocase protein TatA
MNMIILFLDSLGGGEVLVILLFILIFFGSGKIPDLARGLGKGMREIRDAMQGVQSEIRQSINETNRAVDEQEITKTEHDADKQAKDEK